jgi:hypothetical protein
MAWLVLSLALASATGCQAHTGQGTKRTATTASPRWREMTWAEYYNQVLERAHQRGAMVLWVNPPDLKAPAPAQPPKAASRSPAPHP